MPSVQQVQLLKPVWLDQPVVVGEVGQGKLLHLDCFADRFGSGEELGLVAEQLTCCSARETEAAAAGAQNPNPGMSEITTAGSYNKVPRK